MAKFKDHFSKQSDEYRLYRPNYPDELFQYLAGLCDEHECVWDCATGNGQAASGLVPYFQKIHATDASKSQIDMAEGPDNVFFSVADASASGLTSNSIDLITVAQALHWFDLDGFYDEVDRVLKPDGILAVWCYGLMNMSDTLDKVFYKLYEETVGPFWPPERAHIENGYADLYFPYDAIETPIFQIKAQWTLERLLGYFRSWSATMKYIEKYGNNPVDQLTDEFSIAWGNEKRRTITWPLSLIIGKK